MMTRSFSVAWPGAPLALASAILFGASTPFAKLLLGDIDPWLLAGLLYAASGLGLAAIVAIRRALGVAIREAPLRRSDLPWLAGVVLFGGMVGPVLLMLGLASTTASAASLLLNLEGLATMAIAWIVFRENVDRRILAGALAILSGAVLLSWPSGEVQVSWAALAIAGACLAWGIDNNLTRRLSAADPIEIAMIKGVAAGGINLALAFAIGQNASLPPAGVLLLAALIGFFGYGVSIVLFVLGLRHLGTARTGAYFSIAPFIGAAIAVPLFAEPVTAKLIAAAALMGIGVWLHLIERHEHQHVHEPMEHEHRHVHDEHHRHAHEPGEAAREPHTHRHRHGRLAHSHAHYPDIHHRHPH